MTFCSGHFVPPAELTPAIEQAAPLRILPWITDAATDYIETVIGEWRKRDQTISAIECGSGSSTGYLAQRATTLVSFEHSAEWHSMIRAVAEAANLSNIEWRTAPRPYSQLFAEYPDEIFDIALIDGRDRTSCVEKVRRLLKPGSILVVDNTERISGIDGRGPYFEMLQLLEGWESIHFEQAGIDKAGWTASHRWITSIWRKPSITHKVFYTTLGLPL